MDRRRFLGASIATAVAPWLPPAFAGDAYFEGHRAGLGAHPWLKAYHGLESDLAASPLRVEGRIPDGLRGTLYRNGPAQFERGGVRQRHLFDGDGMVQAYRFGADGVSHRGRFVRTRRFVAESAAGRYLYPAFGTPLQQPGKGLAGPDDMNAANTNVVAHGGRLLALWEGGSAYELDPGTLETLGPVAWRADLKGVPFSAHPKIEPDGTLWNMGAAPNALVIYRIDPTGQLGQVHVMKVPGLVLNHDMVVTERYLVCILPAITFSIERARAGISLIESMEVVAGAPMRLLVIDKADLTKHRWFELPPGFMFHFGNAWDAQGVLRFDYVHHGDLNAWKDDLGAMMRGDAAAIRDTAAHSTQVAVDLAKGTVRSRAFEDSVEFPRVDPRVVARRNRMVWHTAKTPGVVEPIFSSIVRYDVDSGRRDVYRYEDREIVEEHIVVPDPARSGEGAGWLVGCAFDTKLLRTTVNVFDALDLAAGPRARMRLPYGVPPGFHGNFVVG